MKSNDSMSSPCSCDLKRFSYGKPRARDVQWVLTNSDGYTWSLRSLEGCLRVRSMPGSLHPVRLVTHYADEISRTCISFLRVFANAANCRLGLRFEGIACRLVAQRTITHRCRRRNHPSGAGLRSVRFMAYGAAEKLIYIAGANGRRRA